MKPMRHFVFTMMTGVFALASATGLAAKDVDPRLATAQKAFVVASDDMSDAKPIAACLASHLSKTMPLTAVDTKADADIVLTIVKAHLPGNTARAVFGGFAGVELAATLPDGTKLWDDKATFASAENSLYLDIPCNLADQIADKLRQAMRKAREKK